MRLLISFAALFLSALLIQLGSGTLGPLDALSGAAFGWTPGEIGLLGSAHFAGFFIGCWAMPRLIGLVGHSRAFAAAAAVGAIGVILHPVVEHPHFWAGLRVLSGISIAGCYTVIEAWLQAKIERGKRGRVFGIYRLVDLTGSIAAQSLIAVLTPAAYASYNIVAIMCCLCLMPLALTTQVPPVLDHPPKLAPVRAWRISPLACFAIIVAGVTGASFRMVGPLYAVEMDLSPDATAAFLAAAVIGAAAAQVPIGWLADKTDRRWVLNGLSGVAIVVCLGMTLFVGPGETWAVIGLAAGFGATSITIYSVAAAHANDFCPEDFRIELNASLIFFYSVGAILAPFTAAELIGAVGPAGLFWFIAAAHLVLIVFTLYRMTRREAAPATPYRYLPRTSMVLERLWRRPDDRPESAPAQDPAQETSPGGSGAGADAPNETTPEKDKT
ncbi:MAG: MFS transporter [Pseudomonadota bacterium]